MRSLALVLLLLVPGVGLADDDATAWVQHPETPAVYGRQLPAAPGLYWRWDATRSWGMPLLVDTLAVAAERVAWEIPSAEPLFVGDMSQRGGGPLPGHATHQAGLDADLGLYRKGGKQPWRGFEPVLPGQLDAEATWTLIEALLDTGNVKFILLDQGHIRVLRSWLASERGWSIEALDAVFPRGLGERGWTLDGVVRHAEGHTDHMHVQVRARP